MNTDLYLLEPEYRYHADRTRDQLKPVRYRRWRRHTRKDGAVVSTSDKNWI